MGTVYRAQGTADFIGTGMPTSIARAGANSPVVSADGGPFQRRSGRPAFRPSRRSVTQRVSRAAVILDHRHRPLGVPPHRYSGQDSRLSSANALNSAFWVLGKVQNAA
jgi:hypothetical protein